MSTCHGSAFCQCNTGYQSLTYDGTNCTAINNCESSNGGCAHTCTFTGVGTSSCSCNTGYSLNTNAKGCTAVNNCISQNGGCAHICTFTGPGSSACSCLTGYDLGIDSAGCTPINNCATSNGACDHTCTYTGPGVSICSCNYGYLLNADNKTCTAINNCMTFNGGCSQGCTMTGPATSSCSCDTGYAINADHKSCTPINNCASHNGHCTQICEYSGPGESTCLCVYGYELAANNLTCTPINNCAISNGGCSQKCLYTGPLSSSCSCNSGYALQNDGLRCNPVNSCSTYNGGCAHKCTSTGPGINSCACNSGYTLNNDGLGCTPINNCLTNNGGCEQICSSTGPATSSCFCNSGYSVSSNDHSMCTALGSSSSSPSTSSAVLGGAIGGSAGALLLILILIILLVRSRRNQQLNKPFDFKQIVDEQTSDLALTSAKAVPREIKREAVKIIDVLGKGNFGEVSKGSLSENPSLPGYLVAIKVLHRGVDTQGGRDLLLAEASLMAQFTHDNVVRLIGVVTAGDPLLIILEFCEKGSLDAYLDKHDLKSDILLKIAVNCADGMAYLTELRFIHRDLAARNVLLGSDMTAKIADFGMSRASQDKTYYVSKGGQVPVRWTAPEALEHQKFSEQSDVWSFGILMYEIWTQATIPYMGMNNDKVWTKVLAGYRLPRPEDCPAAVYETMRKCWAAYCERPTFAQISRVLPSLTFTINDPVLSPMAITPKAHVAIGARTSQDNQYIDDLHSGKGGDNYLDVISEGLQKPASKLQYMEPMAPTSSHLTYLDPEAVQDRNDKPVPSPQSQLHYMQPDADPMESPYLEPSPLPKRKPIEAPIVAPPNHFYEDPELPSADKAHQYDDADILDKSTRSLQLRKVSQPDQTI